MQQRTQLAKTFVAYRLKGSFTLLLVPGSSKLSNKCLYSFSGDFPRLGKIRCLDYRDEPLFLLSVFSRYFQFNLAGPNRLGRAVPMCV